MPPQITSFEPFARPPDSFREPRQGDLILFSQILTVRNEGRHEVAAANFAKRGGKVLSQEAIAPTDIDMHPMLTHVAAEKPDALYMPIFVAAAAQILRQSADVPGFEHTTLVGGGSLAAAAFIEAAGPRVVGFHICMSDISVDALGKDYPAFVEKYKKTYGEGPISNGHANSYDAAVMVFKAVE
jgi:branched-chain amino acid transport system substrate-binding protein